MNYLQVVIKTTIILLS